jgi:hypothetical protein
MANNAQMNKPIWDCWQEVSIDSGSPTSAVGSLTSINPEDVVEISHGCARAESLAESDASSMSSEKVCPHVVEY